jgi:hypothetical protein
MMVGLLEFWGIGGKLMLLVRGKLMGLHLAVSAVNHLLF